MLSDPKKRADYDTYGDVEGLELEMEDILKEFFDVLSKMPKQKKGPRKKTRRGVHGNSGLSKMFRDLTSVFGFNDTDSFEEFDKLVKGEKARGEEDDEADDKELDEADIQLLLEMRQLSRGAKPKKKDSEDEEWEDIG